MPIAFRIIIGTCVLIELVLTAATLAGYPALRQGAFLLGGFFPQLMGHWTGIYPGQAVGMFATYGFLHAGLLHLGMNMVALAQLLRELARIMTGQAMLAVYAVSQVGAGLAQGVLAPHGPVMVGASGAIFGLAGALLARGYVATRRRRLAMGPLAQSALTLLVLNVALALLVPQIAWQAHLGGFATGAAMGVAQALMRPRRA